MRGQEVVLCKTSRKIRSLPGLPFQIQSIFEGLLRFINQIKVGIFIFGKEVDYSIKNLRFFKKYGHII